MKTYRLSDYSISTKLDDVDKHMLVHGYTGQLILFPVQLVHLYLLKIILKDIFQRMMFLFLKTLSMC